MVADMEVIMVANMEVDMVAEMDVDMVANMEVEFFQDEAFASPNFFKPNLVLACSSSELCEFFKLK